MTDATMRSERILIVDDEKIISLDLQRRLEHFGYTVVGMASDAAEAVRVAGETKPDIILMDIHFGDGKPDGIDAAREIKQRFGIPVIFITAFSDEKTLEKAKLVEPLGYITKPFKERELYSTIDIALFKSAMDKRLQKQERLFSAILHSINDAIIATDTNMAVNFLNPAAEEIVGCEEAQAKGRRVAELLEVESPRSSGDMFEMGPEGERAFFFNEARIRNRNGQVIIADGSVTRIHEKENASEGFLVTLRDVTEIKRLSDTISYQASHDSLTGLSNREEFSFKLTEILKNLKGTDNRQVLLLIDVDRFKAVNDAYGPLAGDELLRQVAGHIQANISRKDVSARIGGDEFAIILRDCELQDGIDVARRVQEAVQASKFVWQSGAFPVSLAIGAVPLDRDSRDTHAVLASADDACHLAKEEGGNKISVFKEDDSKFQKRRGEMEWITKINKAVDESRFVLYHQPIVPLDEGAGLEAKAEILIRLVNEDGSIAGPGDFIPAAERYNLMPLIDRWVVRNSMAAYRTLTDRGAPVSRGIISVNLSGPSLLDEELIGIIIAEAKANRLAPESICFEITETAAIQNLSSAIRFMTTLKDEGFTFALDDFGSGFSSFGYLKNLPVDYLKIDGSFVQSIDESLISYAMVESINSIGHVMGIKTIAEFVKSPEIKKRLQDIGVDYAQGYEIAKPSPLL
jgi:diguanylate cyclase (GGDEF)-like protein/PAS domain S-box-containing protein